MKTMGVTKCVRQYFINDSTWVVNQSVISTVSQGVWDESVGEVGS
jgi:hypothetical protein